MTRTIDVSTDRLKPDRDTLLWAGLLVNTELILTFAYLLLADVTVTEWRYLLFPFVWINLSVWALARTTPEADSRRTRLVGAAIAVGYLVLLAYVGGLLKPGLLFHGHGGGAGGHTHLTGFRVAWLPPGWGPALLYSGGLVQLTLMPYKVVGYVTLAYLVYATVLETAGSAVSGLLGLVSCVSCTWPVIATLAAGLAGSGTAVAAAASEWSYTLGTLAFAVTVVLLRWRPSIRSFR
ncbi:hypothetical protein M0R88_13410 [Halorussus gelatinilyticus]|uniref:Uncharacterized protein n=1 Tax=Halorussus gelatinilyticus TaxID=2937524 RepID=A0A8U0IGZ5_9EURY|nr:hypothetical protein [Halorussus gelatinilyticus]UPV99511.1 hypothetical protein M0R88_13410 [Halorussus gelatinilyticus]